MTDVSSAKRADLAGPGIGTYEQVEQVLPDDYHSLLTPRETQRAIFGARRYIEDELCRELGLEMVQVPLIVDAESGVNDMLDRDGSRTPVSFHVANDNGLHPVDAQVVQAATKWKRVALRQFGMPPGSGLCTDMRAVRKDYFLDHDHSAYVDQWDWERAITAEDRTLEALKESVRRIWSVLRGAQAYLHEAFPALVDERYPDLPEEITFIHAEDLLARYSDLPRKQRENALLQEVPAVFIIGIGWTLDDGYPHELRAADYDDWVTPTTTPDGQTRHGLNGDILVWNPVTRRRHELQLDGHPRRRRGPATAAGAHRAARLAEPPLPPRHRRGHPAPFDRWRYRPVAHVDAAAAQGPPRRGQRDGLAAGPQGHVRGTWHPRAGVTGRQRERQPLGTASPRPHVPYASKAEQPRGEAVRRATSQSNLRGYVEQVTTEPQVNDRAETDRLAIRAVVDAFLAAFVSGPECSERMAGLRELFIPEALIVRTCGMEPAVMGVEEFIAPREALLTGGTLVDFREWPVAGTLELFGDIAHWFGSYAKAGVQDRVSFTGRGMKSIQLVRTADGWRISAAAWDDERDGVTLPADDD